MRVQRVVVALRHFLGEIALQLAPEIGIVRHARVEQFAVERELGIGQQHRQLRPRQRQIALAPLGDRHFVRQEFHRAVELPVHFQRLHQPLLEAEVLQPAPLRQAKAPASAGSCCAAPGARPRRSSRRAARCAPSSVSAPARSGRLSAILILTSTSEVLTPAELSMASVLSRMPASAASMRPRWVMPEVGALADHLAAQLAAGDADGVVGAVAGRLVAFARGTHIGADAAEEQQIDLRLQDRLHQLLRRHAFAHAEQLLRRGAEPDLLRRSADRRRRPPRSASCRSPASSSAADRTAACARRRPSPDRDRDR